MAWAETPDGPWYKLDQPILKTAPDGKFDLPNPKQLWQKRVIERGSWDTAVHDPEIIHGGENIGFITKVMESMIYFTLTLDGALLYQIIRGTLLNQNLTRD